VGIVNIALFTLDNPDFPSTMIRLLEPIRALHPRMTLYNGMQMVQQRMALDAIDLFLIQRSFPRPRLLPLCEQLRRSGKPIVYETDDLLQRVPAHHNKPDYNDALATNIEWLARAADAVTVSTDFLAQHYAGIGKRVVVLPNALSPRLWSDALLQSPPRDPARVRLGLVGSKNHDRDFALLLPVLGDVLRQYPHVDCVFYGAVPEGMGGNERIQLVPPNYLYEQHPQRLASLAIDIALVPLVPDEFNRAKSNIKFLEYGFLGIPGLYADLEPYRETVRHGTNGFLCGTSPAAWREALAALIDSAELRCQIGQEARRTVLDGYMLPAHVQKWEQVFRQALGRG
jgi:glycosyltransferase involved in cell wall biosynthesis